MDTVSQVKDKLWNKNFFLLWQGQLVSVLGDVLYSIALSFWILDITGSTALMGLLSAMTMAPRIILGPFAGVFVDRWDRKKIIVITDLIRGIFVTIVGVCAIYGYIQVWMLFAVGIISGICSAFFNPTIVSTRPDIVPQSKLVKANSVTSLANSSMDMIGSAIGGVLYVAIGAPYMFLFNGVSYLFSAFSEMFISIPKTETCKKEVTFIDDFKVGFKFLKDFRVLRNTFIWSSLLNFFANAGMILLIPYFSESPHLGASKYGFAMTILALGAMSGSILLSILNVKREHKFLTYKIGMFGQTSLLMFVMLTNNYYLMLAFIFLGFFCNPLINTISQSAMMSIVPSEIRGKVMAIVSTISMGLMPIGQLLGGVLAEVFPVRVVMFSLFLCCFVCGIISLRVKNLRRYLEYDTNIDSIEEISKL